MTSPSGEEVAIDGVLVLPLATFPDERGTVYHMLRATDPHFRGFGEIYFSSVYPGVVKAWKRHRSLTANYSCVFGSVRMVLFDARHHSPSAGRVTEVVLGPTQYRLLVVPPGIWHGFQGLAAPVSLVANCASEPYDSAEFDRLPPSATEIPFRWTAAGAAVPGASGD
jgi:dTDP-4-dehydrorhamnose 3,5-epimerase